MVMKVDFFEVAGNLKSIKRAGWKRYNIANPESVADHSFRTALMTMVLADKKLNVNKSLKMALVHDLGESIVGDVPERKGTDFKSKLKKESSALKKLAIFSGSNEIFSLWNEYENNKTKEAKFVQEINKLEMALQAYEYERRYGIKLNEFFADAKNAIKTPSLAKLFNEILKGRK